jgi:hypothetical protein
MKFRIVKQILIKNGFNNIVQNRSDHVKFYNERGCHISIPCKKEVNRMMWKRLVKENNLRI